MLPLLAYTFIKLTRLDCSHPLAPVTYRQWHVHVGGAYIFAAKHSRGLSIQQGHREMMPERHGTFRSECPCASGGSHGQVDHSDESQQCRYRGSMTRAFATCNKNQTVHVISRVKVLQYGIDDLEML